MGWQASEQAIMAVLGVASVGAAPATDALLRQVDALVKSYAAPEPNSAQAPRPQP